MIANPDWKEPEEEQYMHQISIDCLEKLVDCQHKFNEGEINLDTWVKMQEQILRDEIDDTEILDFAIENLSEISDYIASGIVNIRIHRDVEGKMWFGAG